MKTILTVLCCTLLCLAQAQQTITKSYPVKAGQQLNLSFDYPKIVKLSTWDKNEVSITASVSINNGDNNDAFQLIESSEGGTLTIKNSIKDMDKLPKRYTVMKDGKKTVFTSKEAYKEFTADQKGAKYYSEGVEIEIKLDIKVPENLANTFVKSTYGIVELVDFNGQLKADATYGGIDASINEANTGKLSVTTHYGQIYTNLKSNITEKEEKDFYTSITMAPGKGPAYSLKSTYGNLYIRKSVK
jgi:hypothetical protein